MLDRTLRNAAFAALAALSIVTLPAVATAVVPPGLVNPPNRPMQTQHAAKCQKLTNKNVAKYLKTWSKTYAKCIGAIATCVQVKASDPDCLAKAVATCNDKITPLGDDNDKDAGTVLENAVTDFCGSLSPAEAFDDAGGPRFGLLSDRCSANFIQGYSFCLFRQTNCVAERLLLAQMPRARDLLESAGVNVGHAVDAQSCLVNENGSGALSDPKPGKALLACEVKAAKAGTSFASKARGAFAKCADAVMNCAQLKPTQKCVDGAAKTCTKAGTTVADGQTKLAGAITKACEKIPLDDLLMSNGGDVSALASLCTTVGVSSVTTLDDYGTCLSKYERCQVEDSIDFTVPRIEEFFTATAQPNPFNSAFCPAP